MHPGRDKYETLGEIRRADTPSGWSLKMFRKRTIKRHVVIKLSFKACKSKFIVCRNYRVTLLYFLFVITNIIELLFIKVEITIVVE